MQIDTVFIQTFVSDTDVAADGKKISDWDKFVSVHKDKDDTILFGECSGSGKTPYSVSVDFINPASPVPRCSCPSRKIPCKHVAGILHYYLKNTERFKVAEIPESILNKREKIEKSAQKKLDKEEKAATAVKSEKQVASAQKQKQQKQSKKAEAQLKGIENALSIIKRLVRDGLGSLTPKALAELKKQTVDFGNSYLGELQKHFLDLAAILEEKEKGYPEAYEQICFIYALLKRGKEYIAKKAEDPSFADANSETEALLGNVWKLTDLAEQGLAIKDASLAQLAFSAFEDDILKQTVETGVWIDLADGNIYTTKNVIPYGKEKYIDKNDTVDFIVSAPYAYKYPGSFNQRVRWDEKSFSAKPFSKEDYKTLGGYGEKDLSQCLKKVKDYLKSPIAGKNPFALARFKRIGMIENEVVMESEAGTRIVLTDAGQEGWFDTLVMLKSLAGTLNKFGACLLRFKYILENDSLAATPLTLLGEDTVLRLGF